MRNRIWVKYNNNKMQIQIFKNLGKYYEELYANKTENLGEMKNFLKDTNY